MPDRFPRGMSAYDKVMAQIAWEGGCLVFTGRCNDYGYGIVADGGHPVRAHRAVAAHHLGESDRIVLHSCDNPPCVNIAHLRYGTHADNVADKMAKGRGGGMFTPRLSADDIAAIIADPRLQREIAADYGVSQGYVSQIRSGKRRC